MTRYIKLKAVPPNFAPLQHLTVQGRTTGSDPSCLESQSPPSSGKIPSLLMLSCPLPFPWEMEKGFVLSLISKQSKSNLHVMRHPICQYVVEVLWAHLLSEAFPEYQQSCCPALLATVHPSQEVDLGISGYIHKICRHLQDIHVQQKALHPAIGKGYLIGTVKNQTQWGESILLWTDLIIAASFHVQVIPAPRSSEELEVHCCFD